MGTKASLMWYNVINRINKYKLDKIIKVSLLALGPLWDCLIDSKTTLKNMGKTLRIWQYQNTTKHLQT